jgi:uncharacterized Zn finger protein
MSSYYQWRPYVPVAERRRQAARKVAALKKKGRTILPVTIDGRKITQTFWGQAWCDNLESYSDYANRLPRGRTYVRNGSVVDLQIGPRRVTALVSGSALYDVDITIKPVAKHRWRDLVDRCAGKIDSVVELLQGRFSKGVMKILAHRNAGLLPAPREISLACSCPDWATMCKHVAAALYGVGARLDDAPEMLFVLRDVDHMDLVARAGTGGGLGEIAPATTGQVLTGGGLSEVFGIDIEDEEPSSRPASPVGAKRPRQKRRKRPAPTTGPAKKRASGTKPASQRRTASPAKKAAGRKASSRATSAESAKGGATSKARAESKVRGRGPAAGGASKRKAKPRAVASTRSAGSRNRGAARPRAKAKKSRGRKRQITARELVELGVPRSTFQNWVRSGVLVRTDRRGVYRTTAATEQRIETALRRRPKER